MEYTGLLMVFKTMNQWTKYNLLLRNLNGNHGENILKSFEQNYIVTLQFEFASSDDFWIHNTCVILLHSFLLDILFPHWKKKRLKFYNMAPHLCFPCGDIATSKVKLTIKSTMIFTIITLKSVHHHRTIETLSLIEIHWDSETKK